MFKSFSTPRKTMKPISLVSNAFSRAVFHKGGKSPRDTAWADGLRGLAAVGVVCSHVVLAFWTQLVRPCEDGPDGPPLLFQRPIFRLVVQGQAMVAIFFILMGFVNPLKALKQASYDDIEGALQTLAKSGISRALRLVLPAAAVTSIAWFACQLGMFNISRWSGAFWLSSLSPDPSGDFGTAFIDLFAAVKNTWVTGDNPYDQPQWALEYLLKGSMYILLLLLVTIAATPKFRIMFYIGFYCLSWAKGDALVGHNIAPGMLLAELHTLAVQPFRSWLGKAFTFFTAFLGLYFMSFPNEYQDFAPWSRDLLVIGGAIYPESGDLGRFWTGIGAQMLCYSIYFNTHLRALLSIPLFTWLGSISFSLYLLHGTMMRTLLAYLAFGPAQWLGVEYVDDHIPRPGGFHLFISLAIFTVAVLVASKMWSDNVEPMFGRATVGIQKWSATVGRSSSRLSTPRGSPHGSPRNVLPISTRDKEVAGIGQRLD